MTLDRLHILKTAIRRLRHDVDYAAINYLSFSVALACCLILYSVVAQENSYDTAFSEHERVYRVVYESTFGNVETRQARGPSAVTNRLKQDVPVIEQVVSLVEHQDIVIRARDQSFVEIDDVYYASREFLGVFDFPLHAGERTLSLADPNSVVITAEMAERLFGELDVVGQSFSTIDGETYAVAAVLARDAPLTHLDVGMLIPMPDRLLDVWNGFVSYVYVKVTPGADEREVEARIDEVVRDHAPGSWSTMIDPYLQPVSSIHLESKLVGEIAPNSDVETLRFLTLAVLLVFLLIALNYVNMSSMRSTIRGKETGVRKLFGATRVSISAQFVGEAVLLAALTIPLALLTFALMREGFGEYLGIEILVSRGTLVNLVVGSTVIALVLGLLSGTYPAVLLSNKAAVESLSGRFSQGRGFVWVRRVTTVFQFAITLFFFFVIIVMVNQIVFLLGTDLGYDPGGVYAVESLGAVSESDYERLERELLGVEGVASISYGSLPGETSGGFFHENEDGTSLIVQRFLFADGYEDVLDLTLTEGRFLQDERSGDAAYGLLLNEAAVRHLGLTEPLGERLRVDSKERSVVGVMEDFHFYSLHQPIPPLFVYEPYGVGPYILIEEDEITPLSLDDVRRVWSRVVPGTPFLVESMEARVAAAYAGERQLGLLLVVFSVIATVMAYLGLYTLVSYLLDRRKKEIAVRRVVGASVWSLTLLVIRETIVLFTLAALAAGALAAAVAARWLEGFAYIAPISPVPFVVAIAATVGLIVLVSWMQVYRTSRQAPSEVFRMV